MAHNFPSSTLKNALADDSTGHLWLGNTSSSVYMEKRPHATITSDAWLQTFHITGSNQHVPDQKATEPMKSRTVEWQMKLICHTQGKDGNTQLWFQCSVLLSAWSLCPCKKTKRLVGLALNVNDVCFIRKALLALSDPNGSLNKPIALMKRGINPASGSRQLPPLIRGQSSEIKTWKSSSCSACLVRN